MEDIHQLDCHDVQVKSIHHKNDRFGQISYFTSHRFSLGVGGGLCYVENHSLTVFRRKSNITNNLKTNLYFPYSCKFFSTSDFSLQKPHHFISDMCGRFFSSPFKSTSSLCLKKNHDFKSYKTNPMIQSRVQQYYRVSHLKT